MSTLSQFNSGVVPVGTFTIGPSAEWGTNPRVSGAEYLAAGNVKIYTTDYSGFISTNKFYGVINSNFLTNFTWANTWSMSSYPFGRSHLHVVTQAGSNTFFISFPLTESGGSSLVAYYVTGNDLVTDSVHKGTIGATGSSFDYFTDFCEFGANVYYTNYVASGNIAIRSFTSTGAATNRGTSTQRMLCIAANSGLIVVAGENNGQSGNIWTSTDGVTFTARTPSVNTAASISRLAYSNIGNVFIMVSGNKAYTTTDGYTMTERATFSDNVGSVAITLGYLNRHTRAATANCTVIYLNGTRLLRTNSGTTFTEVDISQDANIGNYFSLNSFFPPGLTSIVPPNLYSTGSTIYIVNKITGAIGYTTDNAVSWILGYRPFEWLPFGNTSGVGSIPAFLPGSIPGGVQLNLGNQPSYIRSVDFVNGNTYFTFLGISSGSTTSKSMGSMLTAPFIINTANAATPNAIGVLSSMTQNLAVISNTSTNLQSLLFSNYNTNYYLRIK